MKNEDREEYKQLYFTTCVIKSYDDAEECKRENNKMGILRFRRRAHHDPPEEAKNSVFSGWSL